MGMNLTEVGATLWHVSAWPGEGLDDGHTNRVTPFKVTRVSRCYVWAADVVRGVVYRLDRRTLETTGQASGGPRWYDGTVYTSHAEALFESGHISSIAGADGVAA